MFANNSSYESEVRVTPEKHLSAFSILAKFSRGKLFKPRQPDHESLKYIPAEVFSNGKLVRLEQLPHAALKSVPAEVFNSGKLVKP